MELNKFIFKKLIATIIILIILLFASNIAWIIYESQFQTITESTEINSQKVENIEKVRDIIQGETEYARTEKKEMLKSQLRYDKIR